VYSFWPCSRLHDLFQSSRHIFFYPLPFQICYLKSAQMDLEMFFNLKGGNNNFESVDAIFVKIMF